MLAVGVLVTGSIWARASWGHWWVWDEPMLVVFLIVFLLYATYQPLRFSIEDPEKQARYASVFAIVAGAFVPLYFGAVRMAENLTHPQTRATMTDERARRSVTLTFLVALLGMTLLFITLCKYEMASKNATFQLRALRRRLAGDDDDAPARPAAAPRPSSDAPRSPLDEARQVRRRRLPRLPRSSSSSTSRSWPSSSSRIEREVVELAELVEAASRAAAPPSRAKEPVA